MKKRTFLISCGILAVTGYGIIKHVQQKHHSAANQVLETVKAQLGKKRQLWDRGLRKKRLLHPQLLPGTAFTAALPVMSMVS